MPQTIRSMPVMAALVLVLTACSSSGSTGSNADMPAPTPTATPVAAASATPTPVPTSTPTPAAKPVARADKTDTLDYSYKYPAQAAAIPALKALLDQRGEAAKAKALSDAKDDQADAAKNGFPFNAHSYDAEWTVAADTPRFLSLVATISTFTGGAHGMTVFDPLLWDKQVGKPIAIADLFTSHQALEQALRSRFCAALDRERAKRRGEPVKHDDDPFDACIDPAQEAIVPTAKSDDALDGFTVYVAPYDAGPYAEGDYEIHVPIDAALLAAIKPAYRASFRPSR